VADLVSGRYIEHNYPKLWVNFQVFFLRNLRIILRKFERFSTRNSFTEKIWSSMLEKVNIHRMKFIKWNKEIHSLKFMKWKTEIHWLKFICWKNGNSLFKIHCSKKVEFNVKVYSVNITTFEQWSLPVNIVWFKTKLQPSKSFCFHFWTSSTEFLKFIDESS